MPPAPNNRYESILIASSSLKARFLILSLLVFFLPFQFHFSNVLIVIAALQALIHIRIAGMKKFDLLTMVVVLYFLLEALAIAYTQPSNRKLGFAMLDRHQAFILIPLIFLMPQIHTEGRQNIITFFQLGCLLASFVCIIYNINVSIKEYHTIIHPWRFSHLRFTEPIGVDPVYFAMYLSLAIIAELNKLHYEGSLSKTLVRLILIAFFFLVLIILGARTITLILMLLLSAFFLYYSWSRRSVKILLIGLCIPVIFALAIWLNPVAKMRFMDVLNRSYETSHYGSYFARWKIWEPGLEIIEENFWLGVGTGDCQTELDKKFVEYGYLEGVGAFNLHNQYLQTQLAYGIIGFSLFLPMLFLQFKEAVRRKDFVYFSFLCLFAFGCVTESMLNRNKGVVFFLFFSFLFHRSNSK